MNSNNFGKERWAPAILKSIAAKRQGALEESMRAFREENLSCPEDIALKQKTYRW